jgi:hypothetical protein
VTEFEEAVDCICGNCQCDCAHCLRVRAAALGFGPPPWDHRVWARIAPVQDPGHDDPIRNHPDVILAVKEQESARENFDALNDLWMQAVEAHSRATLLRPSTVRDRIRVQRLAAAVEEADGRRQIAWERVVEANGAIAAAQKQARRLQPEGS